MRILQKDGQPPTWEFNEVSEEDRRKVAEFIERTGHGTVVTPWEPFMISFTDPPVIAAFESEFDPYFDR
jgi:hypothetical protein